MATIMLSHFDCHAVGFKIVLLFFKGDHLSGQKNILPLKSI